MRVYVCIKYVCAFGNGLVYAGVSAVGTIASIVICKCLLYAYMYACKHTFMSYMQE